jgi:hypothetical protein
MICTDSLYQTCQDLFVGYPEAVRTVDAHGNTVRSIVLMVHADDDAEFFVLEHNTGASSSFTLHRWPHQELLNIQSDTDALAIDPARTALSCGIPFPADGSLFGWSFERAITALVAFYSDYSPASPQPSWAVMPLDGGPEEQWPPFTEERMFGSWFWQHYQARRIISLDRLIESAEDTVFWADTKEILGSDCCAVARDLRTPEGDTLQHGRYVYYQALRAGRSAPALSVLLAGASTVNLAPRFQQTTPPGSRPREP